MTRSTVQAIIAVCRAMINQNMTSISSISGVSTCACHLSCSTIIRTHSTILRETFIVVCTRVWRILTITAIHICWAFAIVITKDAVTLSPACSLSPNSAVIHDLFTVCPCPTVGTLTLVEVDSVRWLYTGAAMQTGVGFAGVSQSLTIPALPANIAHTNIVG